MVVYTTNEYSKIHNVTYRAKYLAKLQSTPATYAYMYSPPCRLCIHVCTCVYVDKNRLFGVLPLESLVYCNLLLSLLNGQELSQGSLLNQAIRSAKKFGTIQDASQAWTIDLFTVETKE